jgi:hypothetical protein
MENIMSEETGPVSVDDVLAAIQQKNLAQAKAHFNDVMGDKINGALDAEKVKIANVVFNNHPEESEEEVEAPEEHDVVDELEDEVDDAFKEEEVESDAEVD